MFSGIRERLHSEQIDQVSNFLSDCVVPEKDFMKTSMGLTLENRKSFGFLMLSGRSKGNTGKKGVQ